MKTDSIPDLVRLNPHSVDPVSAFVRRSDRTLVRPGLGADIREFIRSNPDVLRVTRIDGADVVQDIAAFPNDISTWSRTHLRLHEELLDSARDRLGSAGLSLKDGHPYNVVFFGSRPYLVDFGSITEHGGWDLFTQERTFYQRVGRLLRYGTQMPLRRQLATRWHPSNADLLRRSLEGLTGPDPVVGRRERLSRIFSSHVRQDRTIWTGYESPIEEFREGQKARFLREALAERMPGTVLDLGCNMGAYSVIAAESGAQVLAMDVDEVAISYLTGFARDRDLGITAVVADLPLYYAVLEGNSPLLNPPSIEFVICYAILHHLVHRQGYNFRTFFNAISRIKPKTILVEFVSYEDKHVSQWSPKKHWYNIETLCEMAFHFGYVARVRPPHYQGRRLVLFDIEDGQD